MPNYNNNITRLDPTKLVNADNANEPNTQLSENIEYILNFLNGNRALLSGVFGNLWDFDKSGKRVLINGGKFDSFEKVQKWTALDEFQVVNDVELLFNDGTLSVANNYKTLVYDGRSPQTEDREKWIEREIWIPEPLRDQQLMFSMKSSIGPDIDNWDNTEASFETIAIKIIGSRDETEEFKTVGYYTDAEFAKIAPTNYGPEMTTVHVPFWVNKDTQSVKIRVYRTGSSDYLHIDKVFVGGVIVPSDDYELNGVDINELYNFEGRGNSKVISTAVLGHKVPESYGVSNTSDVVTYNGLYEALAEILAQPDPVTYVQDLQQNASIPVPTEYPDIFGYQPE